MAKQLLPNRISKTIAPDALTTIRKAVEMLHSVLGEDTFISEADYKSLPKIADKRKQETDDVMTIAQANPEFVHEPLSLSEMEKDKAYYELCDFLSATLKSMLIKLEREQNIAGAEYQNACGIFESLVRFKAGTGNSKANNLLIQLSQINRNVGGNTKKVVPNSTGTN
jgi:hypothetical protein